VINDSSNYWVGKILLNDAQTLNVIATHLPQMGMVATATACAKVIEQFRPRYLLMTGFAAGLKGK
jgi:nucleoside phosphorylase